MVSSILQYPATCLTCTYGGGLYPDGMLFTGHPQSTYLQWYRFSGTPAHLINFHKFAIWDDTALPGQRTAQIADISIGTDCSRLYALFLGAHSETEYSIWVNYYEVDLLTGNVELSPAYIPLPLSIPKAYGYKLVPFPTSTLQAQTAIAAHGFMGTSQQLPKLSKYCKLYQYKQYLLAMYPVYFEDYPLVYQMLSVLDSSTGRLVGAFCIGSVPAVDVVTGTAPLKTNMWVLDGRLWFTSTPPYVFRNYWELPAQSPKLVEALLNTGTVHDVWKDMYTTPEETAPTVYIEISDFLDLLGQYTIYSPLWLPVEEASTFMGLYNTTEFDALSPDLAGTFLYGVKENRLQEYRVDYLQFEIQRGNSWIPIQGLTQYYWQVIAETSAITTVRLINTSTNTHTQAIVITGPAGVEIAVHGESLQGNELSIATLAPGEFVELDVQITNPLLSEFTDMLQISYVPIQETGE